MSTLRQEGETNHDGRRSQRDRTRGALIDAAQQLLEGAAGRVPTVAEAAAAAGVSRATAYRYFPTQQSLAVELSGVTPDVAPVERLLERYAGAGPARTAGEAEARVLGLIDEFGAVARSGEEAMRTALMVYQDTWLRAHRARPDEPPPSVREGRRMRWLETALDGLDLPADTKSRLTAALALTVGMDSLVVLKDVVHLDDDEALETLRWAARAMLAAAVAERD